MNKMRILQNVWAVALAITLFACESSDIEIPLGEFERGVLVMNEGNFGTNDGEIFHFNPENGEVSANIFESHNSRPFAGLVQDMVLVEDRLYLVANTGKVEIVNANNFSGIGAVSSGSDQPRSLVVAGGKLFISDYGPYDENYATPNSYISVVNSVQGGTISKKIPVSRKPEGLYATENRVMVAVNQDRKMEVIDLATEEVVETREIVGAPHSFFEVNGQLYLYARDANNVYFHRVDRNTYSVSGTVTAAIDGSTNNYALGRDNSVYVITSTGWPDYNDAVSKLSLSSGEVINASLITGTGFYGIGYDPANRHIYIGDNNAFQGNGTVLIFNEEGQGVNTFDAGRAPSGFLFR